jgi:hypothetical protein
MEDYIQFEPEVLDNNVSISIDTSLRNVLNLLSLLRFDNALNEDTDSDLVYLYSDIFDQVKIYGTSINGDDNE